MSADFWAGYISGAAGIVIGNPLDIIKVKLQNGTYTLTPTTETASTRSVTSWIRGATAPILTYGALNAILYTTYNRCLNILDPATTGQTDFPQSDAWKIWTAGAVGGLATWIISTPTELIKCQTQLQEGKSSWSIARDVWRTRGLTGLYHGGAITSIRDAFGYGFYFWSYEVAKRNLGYAEAEDGAAIKVLFAGGIAGVVTWTSIYPLDVLKTRVQSPAMFRMADETAPLTSATRPSAWSVAKSAYRQEGVPVFFRGLGVCSIRAFIVNAVQWFVYEKVMSFARLHTPARSPPPITMKIPQKYIQDGA